MIKVLKRALASASKTTALHLLRMKRQGTPIVMATAYDHPSAMHVERAGCDVILVGDSVGMVVLGYDTTQAVTMEDMLHHCKAVSRGASRPLLVGDMPFGSYEVSSAKAVENVHRLVKEGGMDAVKVEGATKRKLDTIEHIVDSGVAVMGHIGLTPQAVSVLGGFRAQGRTAVKARQLIQEARDLQSAGAFAIVVECVPSPVAKAITEAVQVPTIGIGCGRHTSGQVLVYHDLLGIASHPQHQQFVPRFCKQYGRLGDRINAALEEYCSDVRQGMFPSDAYSPYTMSDTELALFEELMQQDIGAIQREKEMEAQKQLRVDEYESTGLNGK